MNIDFTLVEIEALADAAGDRLEDDDPDDTPLAAAWLKLIRVVAEQFLAQGLAVPAVAATAHSTHSPPAVGTADSVPAPIPGVTRMGAGTVSSDTWGLR